MKKFMDKIKKNNKGFTLVELIVVIAIIAIITVVVAPQYLSYVEKSKEATDRNAMGEIAHAAEIAMIEAAAAGDVTEDVTVSVDNDGTVTCAALGEYLTDIIAEDSYEFKSKKFKEAEKSITVDYETGKSDWTDPTETTTQTP